MKRATTGTRRAPTRWRRGLLLAGWMLQGAAAHAEPATAPAVTTTGAQGSCEEALASTRALVAAYGTCGRVDASQPCAPLDRLFDFAALTQGPMVGHRARLSAAQNRRFEAAFARVVRQAARRSGQDLAAHRPAFTFLGEASGRAKVDVHLVRPEDDVDAHVVFVWRTRARPWQVVDVELDGASMVDDYRAQFGRVLKKEGAEALVARVEARSGAATEKAP